MTHSNIRFVNQQIRTGICLKTKQQQQKILYRSEFICNVTGLRFSISKVKKGNVYFSLNEYTSKQLNKSTVRLHLHQG